MNKPSAVLLQLNVESGLHAGAEIIFSAEDSKVVGGDPGSDILLADEGFPQQAATLEYDAGRNMVKLKVLADGIKIFNYKLPIDTQVNLIMGTRFSIANVQFLITIVSGWDELTDDSGPQTASEHKKAKRFFLMQFNRREYFFAEAKQLWKGSYVYVVCLAVVVIVVLLLNGLLVRKVDVETNKFYANQLISKFENVVVTFDPETGVPRYTGHVDDQAQLNELRELAFRLDFESLIGNVMPMDSMMFNTRMFLDGYYQEPQISISGPGELVVRVMGAASVNELGAWDFSSVEGLAKQAIPGLKRLHIVLVDPNGKIVRTPLEGTGLSIISGDKGTLFVRDASSRIFFEGAMLKQGKILKVFPCSIRMSVPGEEAIFELSIKEGVLEDGCG